MIEFYGVLSEECKNIRERKKEFEKLFEGKIVREMKNK